MELEVVLPLLVYFFNIIIYKGGNSFKGTISKGLPRH
jgi:hypothetical protein